MILALHLDNLLFLLFVAVAILFQLLTRAASRSGRRTGGDLKRRSASPSQLTRQETGTEEDRIRKFLEALGQPTTSKPPPPVGPRPAYQKPVVLPHVPPLPSPLPPLKTRPPDLPPQEQAPTQAAPREERTFEAKSKLPALEVHRAPAPSEPITEAEVRVAFEPTTPPISKQTESKIDIATLLRSTSGLRQAVLLREIFGPPRSLQPLDLVGTV